MNAVIQEDQTEDGKTKTS